MQVPIKDIPLGIYGTVEDLLRDAQKMWAKFWLPIVAVGFMAGLVIGICVGRLIEMPT